MGGAPGVDMAAAARQMQNMSSDDFIKAPRVACRGAHCWEQAKEQMKNMGAGEMEAKAKQVNDQMKYARDCAARAKTEGNKLFQSGSHQEAIDKYSRAADALKMDTSTEVCEAV